MLRLSLVALLLVSCKQHESSPSPSKAPEAAKTASQVLALTKLGKPVTPGTLKLKEIDTGYGIAVAAGADVDALEKLARKKGPKLEVKRVALADLFGPEQLAFLTKNLSPADVKGLEASPAVILLRTTGTEPMKLVREIAGVTRDVADAAHGWVLDPETFEIFPAAAFKEHVPGDHPDVRTLIVVHSIMGDNEQPFLDTAGMHRYGFPELYFSEAATSDISQVTHLMNAVAQTLIDGDDVNANGEIATDFHKLDWDVGIIKDGTGKARWKTRWAKERDAHDDDPLVVELVPSVGEGTVGAKKLIVDCFGAEPDKITMLKDDDPEILAAAEKARADLTKLRTHFAKGIPFDEQLTVKAKFVGDDGQVEWMWVDVVAFRGTSFAGTLANDPELIKTLHDGQKVKVKFADVADYLHEKKGGETAGGYSIEVMRKRGLLPADY